MQRTIIAATVCLLLSACSSTPDKTSEPVPDKSTPVVAMKPIESSAETEAQRLERIVKILADKSVYFDYDNYVVKSDYQEVLKQDYQVLKSASTLAVRLEGNADERGSTEYNLALGQKRAEAVKRALQLFGLPESRIEAVSYGKEKPRATCREERCWAENRRVDLAAKPESAR